MQTTPILLALFQHKAWANEQLFAMLTAIDANVFPTEVGTAIRVLNHAYVVDSIFKCHLTGVPHGYAASNTKQMPALQTLAQSVRQLDAWYVSHVEDLDADDLRKPVRFTFTDGDAGLMTQEEILMHLITHGASHRGGVNEILRRTPAPQLLDMFTRFLHQQRPVMDTEAVA